METAESYTQLLVARYLKKRGLVDSLASFLKETSLSKTALLEDENLNINDHLDNSEDLVNIVKERIEYNEYNIEKKLQNLNLNNVGNDDINLREFGIQHWNHDVQWGSNKSITTKMLSLGSKFLDNGADIAISMANKQFLVYDNKLNEIKETISTPSVIKLFGSVPNYKQDSKSNLNYACTMDGTIYLFDKYETILNTHYKLHQRMITHIDVIPVDPNCYYIVSTGLDQMLKVSYLQLEESGKFNLREIDNVKLNSNCSSLITQYSNDKSLSIFLTRNDFTQISCYSLDNAKANMIHKYYIALNNAQFSTHSFNVRGMTFINERVIAVVTSHIPYLRVILVEVPKIDKTNTTTEVITYYDKVLMNIATQISNSSLSQPLIKYLSKGNGLLIGNDDGLYVMDLFKYESWSLKGVLNFPPHTIVKSIDISNDNNKIICTFADKSVHMWIIEN